jgi:hypothetical protein
LREKARMRGGFKGIFPVFILLTPTLSSRRGSFFLNLTTLGLYPLDWVGDSEVVVEAGKWD